MSEYPYQAFLYLPQAIDRQHGRTVYEVQVLGETPTKLRIKATERLWLEGRERFLEPGDITLVPKSVVGPSTRPLATYDPFAILPERLQGLRGALKRAEVSHPLFQSEEDDVLEAMLPVLDWVEQAMEMLSKTQLETVVSYGCETVDWQQCFGCKRIPEDGHAPGCELAELLKGPQL